MKINEIEKNEDDLKFENKEKNENTNSIISKTNYINNNNEINLLKKIFKYDELKGNYLPIIEIDCSKEILSIFNNGKIPKYTQNEELFIFIKNQINIINEMKKIIGNYYEILQIIINYLEKNKIIFVEFLMDLYFECIKALHSENPIEDILKKNILQSEYLIEIKENINWVISCGFFNKNNLDYFYQKISQLQLINKLNDYNFYEYLDLLEVLYGKQFNKKYKEKLIAKNYLYFYNKEKSGIKINIFNNYNNININYGCSFIIWFYINNNIEEESILCDLIVNENQNIEFILNKKNDIIVKYKNELLNSQNNKVFNVSKLNWIQLKIQINKNQIKLNLFQGDINSLINSYEESISKEKYETKLYMINTIYNNNLIIKSMNFFKNYIGLVGTIIFCNNDNPSEIPIFSQYGLKSNDITNFIGESGLSNIYFIITPSLFINQKNIFIDLSNNIVGEIQNEKYNIDVIDFNNVYKYKNVFNNIYNLGGSSNLLPLFEIFYKFTKKLKNDNNEEENILFIIFKKLIKILELIFVNKKKNYLEALYNNQIDNNSFFETLQLFLSLIDEKYYQQDNEILNSLLNIGKTIFKYCRGKEKNNKEIYNYYKYILFNPNIVIKYNISQQDNLWNFFENLKTSNIIYSNSDYKKCFMSIENLNTFLLLYNKKYKNDIIKNKMKLSPTLLNIIRIIFEDSSTNDKERENLFLCNSNNPNNNILQGIIEIFIFYLDINKNSIVEKYTQNNPDKINLFKEEDIKESVINSRTNSVNYLLNSQNNFIEILLNIFSTTNINLKKVLINFIKILTQKYGDILENYFMNIDIKNKKIKGKNSKINKIEFYYFIEENISPNYLNILIQNEEKSRINKKKINIKSLNKQKTLKEKHKINLFNTFNKENSLEDNKENKILEFKEKKDNNKNIDIKINTCIKRSLSLKVKKNIKINFKLIDIDKDKNKELSLKEMNKIDLNKNNYKETNNNLQNEDEKKNLNDKVVNNDLNPNKENGISLNEIQKINCEISMILFDWLLKMEIQKKNLDNYKSMDKNMKNKINNKSNSFYEEKIINFLVKFLSNTKDVEVIYKLLFIITSQKYIGSIDKIGFSYEIYSNSNYYHLLDYFSFTNTKFLLLIEELLINSYLCIYDDNSRKKFIFIPENKQIRAGLNNKDDYFNIIYMKSKELLLDIYFHENNENKNAIIYNIINIILLLNDVYNINQYNLLIKLLDSLLLEICDIYHDKLDFNKFKKQLIEENNIIGLDNNKNIKIKEKNKSLKNQDIINNYQIYFNSLIKHYIGFGPFILEYCLLINNRNIFLSKNDNNMKKINDFRIPDILENTNNLNVYFKFFEDIMPIFGIDKLLIEKNKNLKKYENDKEIYIFSKEEISKLINEYIYNKDYRNKLRYNLELLLIKYNNSGYINKFPLIEILSILNNYCMEKYLNNNDVEKSNNIPKRNFILFLNSHQYLITYIILISCNIKENDNYTILNTTYKEIQDILYISLKYNINNIIKNMKCKYSIFFIAIFNNILSLISNILETNNIKEGKFTFTKIFDFNKTAIKKLITYYINKYSSFFNSSNFSNFAKNKMAINESLIIDNKDKIIEEVIINQKEELNDDLNMNIFELSKFEEIYKIRNIELNKIKLLLNYENLNNLYYINLSNNDDLEYYKDLYLKIKNYKIKYELNSIYDSYNENKKRKNYRKIKKYLYSWNNSYSNLNAFYGIHNKTDEYKINYKLKYKISNFLSKDLSRKLLTPIIDIDYYMLNFRDFDYKTKLFENKKSKNEMIYNLDLNIFDSITDNILPELVDQNYYVEEACYIQTTHHIRGKIFMSKDINSNSIFFATNKKHLLSHEKLKKYDDYDSNHFSCFGSIFRNNLNNKDPETYININYNEINYIFIRKYCFRNNSLEIYTNNHKSFYFKFINEKIRNGFLENIINKFNKIKKQLFKPIKGIDENNKTIKLGYYKDEENNREYSTILNIKELYRFNKISKMEYLMWINIYGNRSFRDIAQYPVFPWLLYNYESDNFEELISDELYIRDFKIPLGMSIIDDKSKNRKEGYIETYKIMLMELYNENIIKLKMKEEDIEEEPIKDINRRHSAKLGKSNELKLDKKNNYSLLNTDLNIKDIKSENNFQNKNESKVIIKPIFNLPLYDKLNNDKLPKILDYNFNINQLYNNLNIEYEKIPYCFGSHFSNGAYVSYYLCRLFPYSLVMIEIQGSGFDCPERLFINFQQSFYSAATEKSDLREIIPELFTIPELFLNINNFNFGKLQNNNEEDMNKNNENIIIELDEEMNQVEDVNLPTWCKNNPYYFIEKNRILFESNNLNINPWIDLIFGYLQRGAMAQTIGNLYLPYVYDGVMNIRIKQEDILNDREENEFKMRFFEMGVHPTKVFDKKCKINKNKISNQIISSSLLIEDPENILYEIKLNNKINKIIYFNCKNVNSEELFLIDKSFIEQKIIIQENKETNNYIIKDIIKYKELPIRKRIIKNIEYKLIMKQIYKGAFYLIAGLFDGELYIIKNINNTSYKKDEKEIKIDKSKINIFDRSLITALEIDKEEKYIIYGTQKGSLIIYSLDYILFKEEKKFINLIKFFQSHPGFSINSICINSDLNLFADCSNDGFAHIYTLPKCKLVHSIYIESNTTNNYFSNDYIFLSAQPLASISIYSNKTYNFKCYSINGNELIDYNKDFDDKLIKDYKSELLEEQGMSSPIIFTDSQFNDYLLYILNKKYILIKKFPFMENIALINPSQNINEKINNISISNDLKYLYAYEEINNKIYIINNKKHESLQINKENKEIK